MRNLDDYALLKRSDPHRMLSLLESLESHCKNAKELAFSISLPTQYERFTNLVIAGLGGSAIGGSILRSLLVDEVDFPIIVCRNYTIPKLVNQDTLFFAISYSGNTEETLSAYSEAKKATSKLVAVSSGGRLKAYAMEDGFPHVEIPSGIPPRQAIPYLLLIPLVLLCKLKAIRSYEDELEELFVVVRELKREIGPSVPIERNLAKKIATELYGLIPLVYGIEDLTEAVAYRWKTQFNENAKVPAFSHVFPELDHNEIVGWEALRELNKSFGLIILSDSDLPSFMKRRIDVTTSLMEERVKFVRTVFSIGKGKLAKTFSLIYIGDFVSVYLAILGGVDPYPVKVIDYLKAELAKRR